MPRLNRCSTKGPGGVGPRWRQGHSDAVESRGWPRRPGCRGRRSARVCRNWPQGRKTTMPRDGCAGRGRAARRWPSTTLTWWRRWKDSSIRRRAAIRRGRCAGPVAVRRGCRGNSRRRAIASASVRWTGCCTRWVTVCRRTVRRWRGNSIRIGTRSSTTSTAGCGLFSGGASQWCRWTRRKRSWSALSRTRGGSGVRAVRPSRFGSTTFRTRPSARRFRTACTT